MDMSTSGLQSHTVVVNMPLFGKLNPQSMNWRKVKKRKLKTATYRKRTIEKKLKAFQRRTLLWAGGTNNRTIIFNAESAYQMVLLALLEMVEESILILPKDVPPTHPAAAKHNAGLHFIDSATRQLFFLELFLIRNRITADETGRHVTTGVTIRLQRVDYHFDETNQDWELSAGEDDTEIILYEKNIVFDSLKTIPALFEP